MVVQSGREINLHFCTVLSNGKLAAVLDISLDQHHPVRLAEPLRGTLPGIPVHLHLCFAVSGLIKMPLESGPLENAGSYTPFQLQDEDDLAYGSLRYLALQQNCFLQQVGIVCR